MNADGTSKRLTPSRRSASWKATPPRAAITIGTTTKPNAVASWITALAALLRSPSLLGLSMSSAGIPRISPTKSARMTPNTAATGPQFEYGKAGFEGRFASMAPQVSQVSRSTKTRLRFLRRVLILVVFLVLVALALAQFTELHRLATGILASTAVAAAIIGLAAQQTLGNLIAGVQIAISQPIKIGDRISFEQIEGRVTDVSLSYTYVDPGDQSTFVIPNSVLLEGIVQNHSTGETQG